MDLAPQVKFRWQCTVETSSELVLLSSPAVSEQCSRIELVWDNLSMLYESCPTPVKCGLHGGAIYLDDCVFPLQEFKVVQTTCEVHLFLLRDGVYTVSDMHNVYKKLLVSKDLEIVKQRQELADLKVMLISLETDIRTSNTKSEILDVEMRELQKDLEEEDMAQRAERQRDSDSSTEMVHLLERIKGLQQELSVVSKRNDDLVEELVLLRGAKRRAVDVTITAVKGEGQRWANEMRHSSLHTSFETTMSTSVQSKPIGGITEMDGNRYHCVRERWGSIAIPDNNWNLHNQSYRKRRLTNQRIFVNSGYAGVPPDRRRKRPRTDSCPAIPAANRSRSEPSNVTMADVLRTRIRMIEEWFERNVQEARTQHRRKLDELSRHLQMQVTTAREASSLANQQQNHKLHHRHTQRVDQMLESHRKKNQHWSLMLQKHLGNLHDERANAIVRLCESHSETVYVEDYYGELNCNPDRMKLTVGQVAESEELDKLFDLYEYLYRSA